MLSFSSTQWSLNVASQMTNAMQIIQECQCDLCIVQRQFVSVIAQGTNISGISIALCCYISQRMPSDMIRGSSDASLAHCAVVCA